jgi:dihydrofolate reductase
VAKVFIDISVSLDGFAAGPVVSADHPMGIGGRVLHAWSSGGDVAEPQTAPDQDAAQAMFANTGAFVLGRRTFDVGEPLWGEDGAFERPCFVVTGRRGLPLVKGPTTFTFVTSGVAAAIVAARTAAGDKDVCIMGGPAIARQALAAGLVDELRLHVVPALLGNGARLFDADKPQGRFQALGVSQTPLATHLHYRVSMATPAGQ